MVFSIAQSADIFLSGSNMKMMYSNVHWVGAVVEFSSNRVWCQVRVVG